MPSDHRCEDIKNYTKKAKKRKSVTWIGLESTTFLNNKQQISLPLHRVRLHVVKERQAKI